MQWHQPAVGDRGRLTPARGVTANACHMWGNSRWKSLVSYKWAVTFHMCAAHVDFIRVSAVPITFNCLGEGLYMTSSCIICQEFIRAARCQVICSFAAIDLYQLKHWKNQFKDIERKNDDMMAEKGETSKRSVFHTILNPADYCSIANPSIQKSIPTWNHCVCSICVCTAEIRILSLFHFNLGM